MSAKAKKAELSGLVRRNLFQILQPDGEVGAEADVQVRLGCRWLVSLWVKDTHRKKGLGSQLLREIIAEFGAEPLYLHVLAFDGRCMPDEKLLAFYHGFGFQDTAVPGILMRPTL